MEQGAVSRLCAEASAQRVEGVPSPHRDPVSLGHKEACPRSDLRTRTAAEEELGAGGGGQAVPPRDHLLGPQASFSAFLCNPYRTHGYLQLLCLFLSESKLVQGTGSCPVHVCSPRPALSAVCPCWTDDVSLLEGGKSKTQGEGELSALVTEQHSRSVPLNLNKPYVVLEKVELKHLDKSSSRSRGAAVVTQKHV